MSITNSSQPVMSFNYGAGCYNRVKKMHSIHDTFVCDLYGSHVADHLGYFMIAFQLCGQSALVAFNKNRQAIFFSLFRKVIIVVPLTLWLSGVSSLEPIGNFVSGSICYFTMAASVYRKLPKSDCVIPSLESGDVVQ